MGRGAHGPPLLFPMRLSHRLAYLAIALPPLAIVVWLFFIPFLSSAYLSLLREDQWSLRNYYLVWRLYRYDILYTLWISFFSLVAVLVIAVFLCGYLRVHVNRTVEFLFKIPLFIPFVVVGHAMRVLLAPRGTLNAALSQIGLVNMSDPPSIAFGWIGISVCLIWKNLALAVLLVLGSYRSVDETFLEAARNFGASTFQTDQGHPPADVEGLAGGGGGLHVHLDAGVVFRSADDRQRGAAADGDDRRLLPDQLPDGLRHGQRPGRGVVSAGDGGGRDIICGPSRGRET